MKISRDGSAGGGQAGRPGWSGPAEEGSTIAVQKPAPINPARSWRYPSFNP